MRGLSIGFSCLFCVFGFVPFASAYTFDPVEWESPSNLTADITVSTAEAQQWVDDSTYFGDCVGTVSTIKVFVNQSSISPEFTLDTPVTVTDIPIGEGTYPMGFAGNDSDNCSWYSGDLFNQTVPLPPVEDGRVGEVLIAIGTIIIVYFYNNLGDIIVISASILIVLFGVRFILRIK